MFSNTPKNNVFIAIKTLLQILNKKISNPTIQRFLDLHPNDLSILAIKDCLKEFEVDTVVVKADKALLTEAQFFPFIAHLQFPSISFVTVTGISDGFVKYIDGAGKKISTKVENFVLRWDGVKLVPTSMKGGNEPSYLVKNLAEAMSEFKLFGIFAFRFWGIFY
jgi:ABC-type bacteriocin/lantibiotic exporter with double-glycine peptidase domain